MRPNNADYAWNSVPMQGQPTWRVTFASGSFARELADLVGLIQTRVAPDDPSEAFELLWAFLQLAPSIYERRDDSNGTIGGVMSDVMEVISDLAPQLATDGTTLADRVFEALQDNGYGEFDGAIPALSEAFGSDGLAHLKTLAQAAGTAPLGEADLAHYGFIGDPERQGEMARDARNRSAARILQDVADLEGDVDAYMARDLLWQEFCQNLSADSLRQHMRRLPDFEDIEAENRARTLAMAHSDMMAALAFFLEWPDLKSAASLIETRNAELNGNAYYHLTPAANALEADHPLAATLVRRAIILDSLQNSRSKRYGYAATHLAECDISDGQINDYQSHPTHSAFIEKLRKLHPRKSAFWSRVTGT